VQKKQVLGPVQEDLGDESIVLVRAVKVLLGVVDAAASMNF